MRKAFFELIEKALSEQQPDPEWITRLYAEMRDKLCALTPRRTDMHKEIHEALDVDLFEQMVRHKAFDPTDLGKLVAFVFGRLQGLCSPWRDGEVLQRREELETLIAQPDLTFAKFAVAFLKGFHATMEEIEHDLADFKMKMCDPAPAKGAGTASRDPSGGGAGDSASGVAAAPQHPTTCEIKARLRQLGVADNVINKCVELRELEALMEQATARSHGTVSGGITHASLLTNKTVKTAPPPSCYRAASEHDDAGVASVASKADAELGALVAVKFKLIHRNAAAPAQPAIVDTTMALPRDMTVAGARVKIATAYGVPADDGIRLVCGGRVLGEDERLDSLCPVASASASIDMYVVGVAPEAPPQAHTTP